MGKCAVKSYKKFNMKNKKISKNSKNKKFAVKLSYFYV